MGLHKKEFDECCNCLGVMIVGGILILFHKYRWSKEVEVLNILTGVAVLAISGNYDRL